MSSIQALADIDFFMLFFWIIIILFAIKELYSLVKWYKDTSRIKTGKEQDDEEEEKRIKTLEVHDKWQYNEIQKMSTSLSDINENLVDWRITTLRWNIVDFTSGLAGGRKYNKESFEQVFSMYMQYEAILQKYGKKNEVVNESMKFIRDKYQEKLRNGDFDL